MGKGLRMPTHPTTKKGRQTRSEILEAARRVFARDGYVDSRMTDIATEAGLSTGGLYRYFENKTEMLSTLIAELHEAFYTLSGHTRHLLEEDPLRGLIQANRGYIECYYENRQVMRVFIEAAGIDERFRVILRDMRDRHVRRFVSAFRDVFDVDEVRGVSVELAAEAMTCMVEQCCYVWFAQEDSREPPTSIDDAVKITSEAWYAAMFSDLPIRTRH